jgi:uridine kinase
MRRRSRVIEALGAEIEATTSRSRFSRVAVDGVDGAGKTFLADELAQALRVRGVPTVRVSVDGFHHPREIRYRRGRTDPEGFFRDSYDYGSFVSLVLEPLAPGGSGVYTQAVHDVDAERRAARVTAVAPPGAVLVVDGIFLHRDELVAFWDYSIWLDVPFEVSIPRGAQRGFGDPDPASPANHRYVEGQRIYMRECAPAERATVIVDNVDLDAPVVRRRGA